MEQLIQGINCRYRDKRSDEMALYENLPRDEQFFKRISIPFDEDELVAIANKEHKYTPLQSDWVANQKRIFEEGLYAYIDGELTFIPGAYWCYINFWTLDIGEKPDYREDDRLFFLFHEYLRLDTKVLGCTRLKGRRQGATSIAMFFMWFIAGRQEFKNCGMTSFSDAAASDAFQRMFMYGFKSILPCFQEDFDSDSENFIRFIKIVDKKKKTVLAVKREGLNSYVDHKSNAINSYDSGRQSYNCPDESGKRNKVDINSYWSRLYKTLLIGKNKVGFAYSPTTVGLKKEGGEKYKLFWEDASQFTVNQETKEPYGLDTKNHMVQYFMDATRCYAGCIDKFGRSVIEDPLEPIMGNDGLWITEGSRTLILRDRATKTGEQLMEHRRDYPLDIFDAFAFETGMCEFIEENLVAAIRVEEREPMYWRRIRLFLSEKGLVDFADDPKGDWWSREVPDTPNSFKSYGGYLEPTNTVGYSIGCDTFKNIFAETGSKGTIVVLKKSHLNDKGEEEGMIPVLVFNGRPHLIKTFNYQVYLACLWYGCKVNFEIDAGTWFYEDFTEWLAVRFLEWTPAIDPTKKGVAHIKPGTESASPFQLAKQLEVAKIYIDGPKGDGIGGNVHRIKYLPILQQGLAYNHAERTPYDLMVALMMALLPILGSSRPNTIRISDTAGRQFLRTYKLKIPTS